MEVKKTINILDILTGGHSDKRSKTLRFTAIFIAIAALVITVLAGWQALQISMLPGVEKTQIYSDPFGLPQVNDSKLVEAGVDTVVYELSGSVPEVVSAYLDVMQNTGEWHIVSYPKVPSALDSQKFEVEREDETLLVEVTKKTDTMSLLKATKTEK